MLVRAKRMGYYNHKRIREGEEFVLKTSKGFAQDPNGRVLKAKEFTPEDQFSTSWMERVDEDEEIPQKKEITNRRKALRANEEVI